MEENKKTALSQKSLKKFLRAFSKGFYTQKYLDWERDYKWNAHLLWKEQLNKKEFERLMEDGDWLTIAKRAVNIEAKTNLLFSFEKMALRDAVKSERGAELFAQGLYNFIYGKAAPQERFENFTKVLSGLPRKQTRVLTWPLQTVFGFIADPKRHIFLKPQVTKHAAEYYGFPFTYNSKPNWETYQSLIAFANLIEKNHPQLKPRDFIDLQSFIWVMGSSEY